MFAAIETLAHELARLLERRGEGARRLAVALFRTDGKVHRIAGPQHSTVGFLGGAAHAIPLDRTQLRAAPPYP